MTVTGSNWQTLTLGKLIPALDPDKEGSLASRMNCEISKIQSALDDNLTKATNLIDSAANVLKSVGDLGNQVSILQNEIENLITNAVNTGVYMHTLGLNPIFSLTSPGAISTEIARTFAVSKISDPNVPVFKGEGLAIVGGVMILVSAPNIQEMVSSVQRLSVVFPVFKQAISTFSESVSEIPDIITNEIIAPIGASAAELSNAFADMEAKDLYSSQPFTDLFNQSSNDVDALQFNGFETKAFDKWYALRLSDLIPALNPDLAGSPANAIMNAERALVGGGISLLNQVGTIGNSVSQIAASVNFLNRSLNKLAGDIKNLVKAIGQTGMFIHVIGMDCTVTNLLVRAGQLFMIYQITIDQELLATCWLLQVWNWFLEPQTQ
jgi:hypothetical protein